MAPDAARAALGAPPDWQPHWQPDLHEPHAAAAARAHPHPLATAAWRAVLHRHPLAAAAVARVWHWQADWLDECKAACWRAAGAGAAAALPWQPQPHVGIEAGPRWTGCYDNRWQRVRLDTIPSWAARFHHTGATHAVLLARRPGQDLRHAGFLGAWLGCTAGRHLGLDVCWYPAVHAEQRLSRRLNRGHSSAYSQRLLQHSLVLTPPKARVLR